MPIQAQSARSPSTIAPRIYVYFVETTHARIDRFVVEAAKPLAQVVELLSPALLPISHKQPGRLRLYTADKLVGKFERVLTNRTILEDISVALITTMNTRRSVLSRIPLHASRGIHVDEVIRTLPTLSGQLENTSLPKHKIHEDPIEEHGRRVVVTLCHSAKHDRTLFVITPPYEYSVLSSHTEMKQKKEKKQERHITGKLTAPRKVPDNRDAA